MFISDNAKANTVSSKNQLDVGQYVRIFRSEKPVMRVLFVGNSITRHGPAPQIGWHGDWGMAASCREKDWVHLTVAKLEEKFGEIDYCIAQGAAWERAYETDDAVLDAHYAAAREFAADLVLIRIGENIRLHDDAPIQPHYEHMVRYFASNPAAMVVTSGCFWRMDALDVPFRQAASDCGWRFASMEGVESIPGAMAIGLFEHDGVARHPSDLGMELIAARIWDAILAEE
ncbi:MAG: SGNH/GDSL hydrolase family protein [Ruminococcaceae bacterium]|nr:SGNH/GDSL hydrolase family protein [Oscillospiraceae bacterium]